MKFYDPRLFLALSALAVSQCSLEVPKSAAILQIDLTGLTEGQSRDSGRVFSAPPTTIAGFDCFAVNVISPKTMPAGPAPNAKPLDQIFAGSHCVYPGVLSQLVPSSGGTLTLRVPKSKRSLIQVLGVISPGGCSVPGIQTRFGGRPSTQSNPDFPGIYEVARLEKDLETDESVTLTGNYSAATPKEVRCFQPPVDCNNAAVLALELGPGAGTIGDPFHICSSTQLQNIATVGNLDKFYVLEKNLDLTGQAAFPRIGTSASPFSGNFNGQGYTITNFAPSDPGAVSVPMGLFGVVTGTVQNLNLQSTISAPTLLAPVGGIVGELTGGTIHNLAVMGSVTGNTEVGGIVGDVSGASVIANSVVQTMSVTGASTVGGFAGRISRGLITNAKSRATVSSSSDHSGGFAGKVDSDSIAGIQLDRCSAEGQVNATTGKAGGFVGKIAAAATQAVLITRSSATGNVISSAGSSNGGFVGEAVGGNGLTIRNSYARGSVTATGGLGFGGFFGKAGSTTFQYCYASTPTVSTSSFWGGFGGQSLSNTYTELFANSAVNSGTGIGDDALATGVSTVSATALRQLATYTSGWNFTTIWAIDDGVSFPRIK